MIILISYLILGPILWFFIVEGYFARYNRHHEWTSKDRDHMSYREWAFMWAFFGMFCSTIHTIIVLICYNPTWANLLPNFFG